MVARPIFCVWRRVLESRRSRSRASNTSTINPSHSFRSRKAFHDQGPAGRIIIHVLKWAT
ncbi:MAG TPA: hypothetical protein DDW73_17435 [Rhizobium sp.]|nr:hypothetical protein [Rhizobium sp.]